MALSVLWWPTHAASKQPSEGEIDWPWIGPRFVLTAETRLFGVLQAIWRKFKSQYLRQLPTRYILTKLLHGYCPIVTIGLLAQETDIHHHA